MEFDTNSQIKLRDQLILAGIDELNKQGIQNFSVRRIAERCGVSCAAPYKHFKDKQSFFAAIISYIDQKWDEQQRSTANKYTSTREQLLAICMEYIRFLTDNPQFRSIIMLNNDDFNEKFSALRGKLSRQTYILVSKYCQEVDMPDDVRRRKTYIVRSLIYGAALMFDNGELDYTDENLNMVSYSLNREFVLP